MQISTVTHVTLFTSEAVVQDTTPHGVVRTFCAIWMTEDVFPIVAAQGALVFPGKESEDPVPIPPECE